MKQRQKVISPEGSVLMLRVEDVKHAVGMVYSKLKCIFFPMFMYPVMFAKAKDITEKPLM